MRRLFVGDIHGCRAELENLLKSFAFRPGQDQLISLGDIHGKGPDPLGCLKLCREIKAKVILGNHDAYLLQAADLKESERTHHHRDYLDSLGNDPEPWIRYVRTWPYWLEFSDLFAVHAGFVPGHARPETMPKPMLIKIRTWDGKGVHLWRKSDPPWYECGAWAKPIVFGHWAAKGLVHESRFHGLDTGCVYGRELTGWCPEENRLYRVKAQKAYEVIKSSHLKESGSD
jgi:Calcineurin-like phosphoesterase